MKSLITGPEARKLATASLSKIADAVATTLGPRGMPFIFEKDSGLDGKPSPTITKDGLTVLRSMSFADPIDHAVHAMCVQASSRTVLAGGDGSTSILVVAAAVARAMQKSLDVVNSPQKLARDVLKQSLTAIDEIAKEAVKSKEMAKLVALTSSNGDEELAEVALQAVSKNNAFGSIIIERNPVSTVRYQLINQDGLVGGKGYEVARQTGSSLDSVAIGQNSPFTMKNPYVLTYDGSLTHEQAIRLVNTASRELGAKFDLVIAAYDIDVAVYHMLTKINLQTLTVNIWAHEMRDTGEANSRWHKLHDIAAFTGATVVNPEQVLKELWDKSSLGTCKELIVSRDKSTYSGRSAAHTIPQRALQNENAIKYAESEFDKEYIKARNAELTSGLVKLIIGAGHTASIQERADRADDAIKAAQACLKTGALPGCGASYIRAAELAQVGPELADALHSVHKTIMNNYGADPRTSFLAGETICLQDDGLITGNFEELKLADSLEGVAAVIRNGVELGILVSTLGGMSLTTDLEEIEKIERAGKLLGGMR